jgi:hypothetical protein
VTDDRPTTLDVPLDHETVIEPGAVPSTWVITNCHWLLLHPWPLMVAPWNEPSP